MSRRRNSMVKPDVFRQRVRRFPRDALLRDIAANSAQEALARTTCPGTPDEKFSVIREGYMFQLAGICLTHCNNHRDATVNDEVVSDLVNGFYNIWDPALDGPLDIAALQRVVSRTAYLQMPYQQSPWEPLMRSLCIFGDDPRFGAPVFDRRQWYDILGVTLPQFLRIGLGIYAAAMHSAGCITRHALLAENLRPVFEPVPSQHGLQAVDAWLARPVDDLVQLGRDTTDSSDDLWSFNPLYEWPIVIMPDAMYVTPSPLGILQRLAPQGLYFLIRSALHSDPHPHEFRNFTAALGIRFEAYIGEQLALLEHATIYPEITYDDSQKSVDYIIETPEVLVLVEAKSVAPDVNTRSGVFLEHGDVQRNLTRACNQIDRTARLIQEGHSKFPSLDNRPMRGLVVTREQYYNLPLPSITDVVKPAAIPTAIVSSQQLETALPVLSEDEDCGSLFLDALTSNGSQLKTGLDPLPVRPNPILSEMWDQWSVEAASTTFDARSDNVET